MSNGGEWAEVFMEDRQSGAAEYDENRVETMVSSRDLGAGIRVTVGDATGFAHTSDISTGSKSHSCHRAARGGARSHRSLFEVEPPKAKCKSAESVPKAHQLNSYKELTPPRANKFGHNASDCPILGGTPQSTCCQHRRRL